MHAPLACVFVTPSAFVPFTRGSPPYLTQVATATGYTKLPEGDESALADAVATVGPVSICIDADSWQTYSGGIMTKCAQNLDHCVQVGSTERIPSRIPTASERKASDGFFDMHLQTPRSWATTRTARRRTGS